MVTQKTILAIVRGQPAEVDLEAPPAPGLRRELDRAVGARGLVEEHHVMVAADLAILAEQIGRDVGLGPGRGRISDRDHDIGRADGRIRTTLKFHDLSVSLDQSRARIAGRLRSLPP